MKVYQLIKRVNKTELKQKGAKDSYLSSVDESAPKIFEEKDDIDFVLKNTNKTYNLGHKKYNSKKNKEHRIIRMGPFYEDNKLRPGDEIIIERIYQENENKYYIDYYSYKNNLVLQYTKNGFELLTEDNIDILNKLACDNIKLKQLKEKYARENAKEETIFYDLIINNESFLNYCKKQDNLKNNSLLEVSYVNDKYSINKINKLIFNQYEVDT